MQIRPDLPAADLLVLGVMDDTQDGLEEQEDQNHDADDGVVARIRVAQLPFVLASLLQTTNQRHAGDHVPNSHRQTESAPS